MKKFLLSLLAVAGLSLAASAETVTLDLKSGFPETESATPTTVTKSGIDVTVINCRQYSTYLMIYGSKTPNGSISFKAPGKISKIAVTTSSGASTTATAQLSVNGANVGSNITLNKLNSVFTFDVPDANQIDGGEYCIAVTSSKNAQFTQAVITYSSSSLKPAGLSFDETSFSVKDNEKFTAPALNNPNNLSVTWASSNEDVATVNAEGAVTIKGVGTTTISATSTANDEFEAGKAEYTLTVTSSLKDPELSFSAETAEVNIGDEFTAPTFNNPNNLPVTWASSNEDVATVANGTVTIIAAGTTTISATSAATDEYAEGKAEYTLTVVDPTAPVTFDFINNTYGLTRLSGNTTEYIEEGVKIINRNITIAFYGHRSRLWSDGLRFYNGSSFEVFAPDGYVITSVKFGKNWGSFDYNGKALTEATWTGSLKSVTFSCNLTNGKSAVNTLTVTYKSDLTGNQKPAELSFVGNTDVTAFYGEDFTVPTLDNPNNLPVIWASSNESAATVDAEGKVTLVGEGTTKITATSEETDDFGEGYAEYTLTVIKKVATVAEFYELGSGNTGVVGFTLTVTYVEGRNIYAVTPAGEAVLIYDENSNLTYAVGDIIPDGWEGKYTLFNQSLPEIIPVGTMPESTETGTVTIDEVSSISEADINKVLMLMCVIFEDATPSTKAAFTGYFYKDKSRSLAENYESVALYNQFGKPSVEPGMYNIKAAISSHNGDLQAYPIEFTKLDTTGLKEVVVDDENAPVEYYNLQGVRVENPANGLYIRRQGNKATKTLIK